MTTTGPTGTPDASRLVAWDRELRAVHTRLRDALRIARDAVDDAADDAAPSRELLLFCTGFCAALDGHHRGEDRVVFPGLLAVAPQLRDVVDQLVRDHAMLSHLLGELQRAVDAREGPAALHRHLDGIEAVMETHFRYEEKRLLPVLSGLALDATPRDALGPLADEA
ncbi:hemerythrin domain-containing protein [Cellulomonas wangsupingiae]|uniref:Hemerythrin domain-containing protein n=1 Tax=Cellulomonas wangsupingiae TaxID=2968085 RepID=A0ABY5K4B6_9CELL|nr:hemerythrin domain-containing protein [Cellulomonas wangsupingiae]MCC2333636.1 hemerythrin domain-containing protein [Cellulomonas wangsupingiae]UUI64903.1 hemerythrin domain-containing protein [Cellulomonas wangsupingiae]